MPLTQTQKDKLEADKAALIADEAKVEQDQAALAADIDGLVPDAPPVVVDPPPVIVVPPVKIPPITPPPSNPPPVVVPPPVVIPPVVIPPVVGELSLTFVPHAMDPAASTNFGSGGGARGYGCMRPNIAGEMILFGFSDGHDSHGYNGIDKITSAGVVNLRPHTVVNLGPATADTNLLLDGRGLNFVMGRDNQAMVVLPNNWLLSFDGEREPGVFANYGGTTDLSSAVPLAWRVTDVFGTMPGIDGTCLKLEDGASARIDALGIAVLFGGYNNLTDWLSIIAPNPAGSANPYKFINFANPDLANQFPGSRHLRYVSNQCFAYRNQLRVYGGHGGDTPTSHYDLYAVDFSDINHPVGTVISTNTLPADQRVQGEGVIAFNDPINNGMLVTNGVLANWYSNATDTWSVVTITNPAANRVTPDAGGSGAFGGYSTAMNVGLVMWANGAIEKMVLSGAVTTPPPIDPPPVDPPPVNPPPVTPPPVTDSPNVLTSITTGGVVRGTCKTAVTHLFLNFDGSEVQDAADVHPTSGAWAYQLPPHFFDGQEHTVYGRANDGVSEVWLDNASKFATIAFRLPAGGTPTGPFVPMPPASTGSGGTPTPEQPGVGGGTAPPPVNTNLTPAPGNLTVVTTAVALPGPMAWVLHGKHFDWAFVGGRWHLAFGDHACVQESTPTPDAQDGNRQRFSMDFTNNDWRQEQNYFIRSGSPDTDVQSALPDDGGLAARLNELFIFTSERVNQNPTRTTVVNGVTIEGETEACRRVYGDNIVVQEMDAIMAIDVITGVHRRVLSPRPHCMRGDKLWRVSYDPHNDFFFSIVNNGGDLSYFRMKGTGEDITNYNPGTNVPAKLNWDSTGLGEITAHVAGFAIDWVGRRVYFYDHYTTRLYSNSIDGIYAGNEVPTLHAQFSSLGEPLNAGDQSTIKLSWDPDKLCVLLNGIAGIILYVPSTNTANRFPRQDGFIGGNGTYVPTSTVFHVPQIGKHVSIGTMDWSENGAIQSPSYWTLKIQ